MNAQEKEELKQMFDRLYAKTVEVHAMMKDGKIIVAYEKLGGVIKVIQQVGTKFTSAEPTLD